MVAFAQRNLERLSADVPWWGRGAERGRKNLKIWVCGVKVDGGTAKEQGLRLLRPGRLR